MKPVAVALALSLFAAAPALAAPAPAKASAEKVVKQLESDSQQITTLVRRQAKPDGQAPARLAYPVAQAEVKEAYGPHMHPLLKRAVAHNGVDFKAAEGTQVLAAGAGTVIYAGWYGGYGKVVIVDHGHGLTTLYAHLQSETVAAGAKVAAGQAIATAGNSGMSTGPHLHFEVRQDGKPTNPMPFFAAKPHA